MQHPLRAVSAAVLLGMTAFHVHAVSFAEAFEAARRFDGQYQVAGHELASATQAVPIARSALLPSVALTASTADVTGTREFPNSFNQEVRTPLDYSSPQAALQLRQALFNYEAWARLRQATAQQDAAQSTYEARGLELVERLGTAYLQVLLSHEALNLAEAEIGSFEGHLARAQQRALRGEGTRTEVAQSQAGLELARARLLEASDQLVVAQRVLRRTTGLDSQQFRRLPDNFLPPELTPGTLEDWLSLAERQSPLLRARQQAVQVASAMVERNRAGHLPRVDLVASMSRSRSESLSSLNQTSSLRSLGVQLSVPLYSGGGVDASVRQSLSDKARAEEELRNERESMQVEVQRQFTVARNGLAKAQAYARAVAASEVVLEGATRSLAAGLGTQADVLEAQSKVFSARRDLAQVRYEYLAARQRLEMQAGVPAAEIVSDIDRLLTADVTFTPGRKP